MSLWIPEESAMVTRTIGSSWEQKMSGENGWWQRAVKCRTSADIFSPPSAGTKSLLLYNTV